MPNGDRPHAGGQIGQQWDLLTGSYQLQFTAVYSNFALRDISTSWGTTSIIHEPAFQWTPTSPMSPAQYAVVANLINQSWPTLGPFTIQTALQVGFQYTDGRGAAATVTPQLDLSLTQADWLHIQGGVQVTISGGDHGLNAAVSLPATVVFQGEWRF